VAPSEDYFHGQAPVARPDFVKGDSPRRTAEHKKKTMKTNKQNQDSGLKNRSEQLSTANTNTAEAQTQKQDNRLPIDREARKQNRTLPTPKVLNLLLTNAPSIYRLAEVVGKWVWVRFTETPAAEIRQQLAQLGFHWNRQRQAWQHPCGKFSLRSQADPHEKYSSYFPVRIRRAAKPQAAQVAA